MIAYRYPTQDPTFLFGQWARTPVQKGFVFAPFLSSDPALYLEKCKKVDDKQFFESEFFYGSERPFCATQQEYFDYTLAAIDALKNGILDKVVTSRVVQCRIEKDLRLLFYELCNQYPNAFVYLVSGPFGTWCGASPEILVSTKGKELETVALAGTLPYREDGKYPWREKEKREQQMVADYIEKVLKDQHIDYKVGERKTVRAGNVAHLKTTFTGYFDNLGQVMDLVQRLHPTPAVCGLPLNEARKFILQNEKHQRAFYTGYLGEVSPEDTRLYVNLRCMQIQGDQAYLYVGGGITAASDANEEWEETQNKAKVLLSVIKN